MTDIRPTTASRPGGIGSDVSRLDVCGLDVSRSDAIGRLVAQAVGRRRRGAFNDLAAALVAAVHDHEPAGLILDVLAAEPAVWPDLDVAVRHLHPHLAFLHHLDPRPTLVDRLDPRPALGRLFRRRSSTSGTPGALSSPGTLDSSSALGELDTPDTLDTSDGRLVLVLMLAACAWDGRERARALAHPLMRTETALLPVLLIRTADWADPVRALALEALEDALRDADATTLLATVPTAARLSRRLRARPALDLVRAALLRAPDDTLDAVRACQDRLGRRFTYEVALDAGRLDPARLTAAALHEHDQICRTRCARALADAAVTHERPDLATAILDGTTAEGRVQALTALVRLGHVEHGHRFVDDPASMVRLTAQWALRKAGPYARCADSVPPPTSTCWRTPPRWWCGRW